MFTNSLFWLVVLLLVWSFTSLSAYGTYGGSNEKIGLLVGISGVSGLIAGIIRVIFLCINYNWWWLLGIFVAFLIISGVISNNTDSRLKTIIGIIGIVCIPAIWWFGRTF